MRDPTPKLVAALIATINAFQTAVRSRFSTSINGLGSRSVFRQDQMIEKDRAAQPLQRQMHKA